MINSCKDNGLTARSSFTNMKHPSIPSPGKVSYTGSHRTVLRSMMFHFLDLGRCSADIFRDMLDVVVKPAPRVFDLKRPDALGEDLPSVNTDARTTAESDLSYLVHLLQSLPLRLGEEEEDMQQRSDIENAENDERAPLDVLKRRWREESECKIAHPIHTNTDRRRLGSDVHGEDF